MLYVAGNYLGRSQDDIRYWEHREHYGFSPSRKVLTDWMNEDPSVDELFVILSKMRFYKAMLLIKDYGGFYNISSSWLIFTVFIIKLCVIMFERSIVLAIDEMPQYAVVLS